MKEIKKVVCCLFLRLFLWAWLINEESESWRLEEQMHYIQFNCTLIFLKIFLMSELETSCHIFQIQLCSCAHEIYWFIISLSLSPPLFIFLFNECKNISFNFFMIDIRLRCLSLQSDLLVSCERFHRVSLDLKKKFIEGRVFSDCLLLSQK